MAQAKAAEAAVDPLDSLWDDLAQATVIQRDITTRLEAARAVPAVLEQQRQRHLLDAGTGDEAAIAALGEIKRQADANAATIADLESALRVIGERIAGCKSRLREARLAQIRAEQAQLEERQDEHFERIKGYCGKIREEYLAAVSLAREASELEQKLRNLLGEERDSSLDVQACGAIQRRPFDKMKDAIHNLEREC